MQRWPRSLMVVYKPCNSYCSFKKYQSARTSALKTLLSETLLLHFLRSLQETHTVNQKYNKISPELVDHGEHFTKMLGQSLHAGQSLLVAELGIGSEDRYLVEVNCRQFGISKLEKYLLDKQINLCKSSASEDIH